MALSKIKGTVIADDAINADRIEDGTVVASDILDNTITGGKLATDIVISTSGSVTANTFSGDGSSLTALNISTDSTPQLGGNLDLNSNNITGTGNIDITGTIDSSTEFRLGNSFTRVADGDGGGGFLGGYNIAYNTGVKSDSTGASYGLHYTTGGMRFYANSSQASGTALTERAVINESSFVINEASNDYDFRVESDTNTHAFFVQGSDGNVGIGTTSPATPLHLNSTSYPQFRITNSISFNMGVDSNNDLIFDPISGSTRDVIFQNSGAGDIQVGIGTTSPSTALEVAGTIKSIVTDNSSGLILESTDDDAAIAPRLVLTRNSATPADGDALGQILFNGTNDNYPEGHPYAKIESKIQDASNATEDGVLDFLTSVASSEGTSRLYIDSTGVTINDASIDSDFRVESDNKTHALFVQGNNGSVAVGTNSPSANFHVDADTGSSVAIFNSATGANVYIQNDTAVTGNTSQLIFGHNQIFGASIESTAIEDFSESANRTAKLAFKVRKNGTISTAMTINDSGNVGIGETSPDTPLHISTTSSTIGTFEYTGADANASRITLLHNSESPADDDIAGQIDFNANESDGAQRVFGRLQTLCTDVTAGTSDGQMIFQIRENNSLEAVLNLKPDEVVFNDSSYNRDFRVESDNSNHMLFVDAGTDRVGIGQSSPAHTLHVTGGPPSGTDLVLFNNSRGSGTPRGFQLLYSALAPDDGNIAFNFEDSSTTRFRVNNDGDVLNHDGTYGTISDQRIKQNITDANSQWEDIKALSFKNFKKKDDIAQYGEENAPTELGLIAQELELTSPNLVKEYPCDKKTSNLHPDFNDWENSTIKGVKYSILYMKAVKALQEAMLKIEDLEARVNTLEAN